MTKVSTTAYSRVRNFLGGLKEGRTILYARNCEFFEVNKSKNKVEVKRDLGKKVSYLRLNLKNKPKPDDSNMIELTEDEFYILIVLNTLSLNPLLTEAEAKEASVNRLTASIRRISNIAKSSPEKLKNGMSITEIKTFGNTIEQRNSILVCEELSSALPGTAIDIDNGCIASVNARNKYGYKIYSKESLMRFSVEDICFLFNFILNLHKRLNQAN